ncbi:MAG TPA: hypothetical protein VNG51_00635 [Ktedonobacteraceae bacterium]|nr:hypothetical protein [Ktedonobacteraceae bacterium]
MQYFQDGLNILTTEFYQAPVEEAWKLFFLETLHNLETGYATQQCFISEGKIQEMLHDTRKIWTSRHTSWATRYLQALGEMRSMSQDGPLDQMAKKMYEKLRDPQILEMEQLVAVGKTQ